MPDFNVRADSVNVEQIMEQIRARIREKRGIDYTEQQLRELASVKLEKFLDPKGVRSDLLDQFKRTTVSAEQSEELPEYEFGEETLYETHRGPLRWMRRLLQPILKLFFNPNPLIMALHVQTRINAILRDREERREVLHQDMRELQNEVLHNLVVELTRVSIEMKNVKMRVESLTSRLEFSERRARALESVVAYNTPNTPLEESRQRELPPPPVVSERPSRDFTVVRSAAPQVAPAQEAAAPGEGPGQRSKRRRRRRGRRGGGSGVPGTAGPQESRSDAPPESAEETQMSSAVETDEELDQRVVRAEPIEQAFGTTSHPAEPTAGDFTPSTPAESPTRAPASPPQNGSDES